MSTLLITWFFVWTFNKHIKKKKKLDFHSQLIGLNQNHSHSTKNKYPPDEKQRKSQKTFVDKCYTSFNGIRINKNKDDSVRKNTNGTERLFTRSPNVPNMNG